jgi:formyl-CoA transferase
MGLDAESLRLRNPSLISCTISGYGTDGPWADRKAYDLLVQCQTGLLSVTGTPEEPVKAGISVADIAAGMYAFSGILTALYTRATTGRAAPVEVSLFEALAEWMSQPAYYTRYGGTPPPRVGAQHATIAPYGPYRAADGTEILLAVQNEREWKALCSDVLGRPELADDPRFATGADRVAHRDELNAVVADHLARLSPAEATGLLDSAKIANAGVNTVAQFLGHPVLSCRDRWRTISVPGTDEPVAALLPPVTLRGVTPRMEAVPAAGEHTETILRALGRGPDDIARLRAEGVVETDSGAPDTGSREPDDGAPDTGSREPGNGAPQTGSREPGNGGSAEPSASTDRKGTLS